MSERTSHRALEAACGKAKNRYKRASPALTGINRIHPAGRLDKLCLDAIERHGRQLAADAGACHLDINFVTLDTINWQSPLSLWRLGRMLSIVASMTLRSSVAAESGATADDGATSPFFASIFSPEFNINRPLTE